MYNLYLANCWPLICWHESGDKFSLLHDWEDLSNDLKSEWWWDLGLEVWICFLIFIPFISDGVQSWPEEMDGLEQEVCRVPPCVYICDDLPELTVNGIRIILQEIALPSDPLMVWWWVVDSGREGLAILDSIRMSSLARLAALTTRLRRWSKQGRPTPIFLVCLGTAANIFAALSVTQVLKVLPLRPAMAPTTWTK